MTGRPDGQPGTEETAGRILVVEDDPEAAASSSRSSGYAATLR